MIVRNNYDLAKLNDNVEEIEFVEFPFLALDLEIFKRFVNLKSLTFTKTFITNLDIIPKNITNLAFYDCYIADLKKLRSFSNLYSFTITNYDNLNIKDIMVLPLLEKLNISYCNVLGEDFLLWFDNLEEIDISYSRFQNYNFLRSFNNLKKVVIDDDSYLKNGELMHELESKNILIYDILGGVFNGIQ